MHNHFQNTEYIFTNQTSGQGYDKQQWHNFIQRRGNLRRSTGHSTSHSPRQLQNGTYKHNSKQYYAQAPNGRVSREKEMKHQDRMYADSKCDIGTPCIQQRKIKDRETKP